MGKKRGDGLSCFMNRNPDNSFRRLKEKNFLSPRRIMLIVVEVTDALRVEQFCEVLFIVFAFLVTISLLTLFNRQKYVQPTVSPVDITDS